MGHADLLTLDQWRGILMSSKQKLYSYVRWSSEKQSTGTSSERQTSRAMRFAEENELEYVEIKDAGVSAFKGKNTTQGKLGVFISEVDKGVIPRDSWLYVENLDRLTREDVLTANELFLRLLRMGLTIVTGMDNRVFTRESVNNNPMDLMASILMFMRAHEESKTKSDRVTSHVLALLERQRKGLPVNIKAIGKHPFWIDDSGSAHEKVKKHPDFWLPAQEAVRLFLEGHGAFYVTDYLNQNYPVPPAFKKTQRREGGWPLQAIKKMRANMALVGTRIFNLSGKEYRLENYYPPLCTLGEFAQLQDIKTNNKRYSGKTSTAINLLGGMKILRCGHCKGTMTAFLQRGQLRYICEYGRSGGNCTAWSLKASIVERCLMPVLITGFLIGAYKTHSDLSLLDKQTNELKEQLKKVQSQQDNVIDAIADLGRTPKLDAKFKALENEEQRVSGKLQQLHQAKSLYASTKDFSENIVDFVAGQCHWMIVSDVHNPKREALRERIRSVINEAIVTKDNRCIRIEFRFPTGETFVFSGSRPGEYEVFLPRKVHEIPLDATEQEINEWERSDYEYNKNFLKLWYEVVNKNLLSHYPAIDGKDFWPKR
ncbi:MULTISPECIES: recombinase family protein [Enterobacteriaceae]|uniref:recombinase family protein n=1 Tax=Enterobacteriaceae TaxID=543 RepID=UPI0009B28959|nr:MULTISPECIES: recombinase family protein [Enterobacteriaceae]ELF1045563.1 recombinase family protein [Enterobacter asburiae]ELY4544918.1 recombinase family protein [Cronobacter sakazakii]